MRLKSLLLLGLMVSPTLVGEQLEDDSTVEFTAYTTNDHVKIHWKASQRAQVKAFSLERSRDGKSFKEIKLVDDEGEIPDIMEFFESDFDPLLGWSYYRIKEVYLDGGEAFTHAVPVFYGLNRIKRGEVISPNRIDTEETMTVKLAEFENQEAVFVLRDAQGLEYYYETLIRINGDNVELDASETVPAGIYTVTACSKDPLVGITLRVK